jgi:hypothetical protein
MKCWCSIFDWSFRPCLKYQPFSSKTEITDSVTHITSHPTDTSYNFEIKENSTFYSTSSYLTSFVIPAVVSYYSPSGNKLTTPCLDKMYICTLNTSLSEWSVLSHSKTQKINTVHHSSEDRYVLFTYLCFQPQLTMGVNHSAVHQGQQKTG